MDARRKICQHYRIDDVQRILGISKSKIYLDISKCIFPPPIKLGRTSVWSDDQLSEFIARMEKAGRQ